jgi:hypothetical protein
MGRRDDESDRSKARRGALRKRDVVLHVLLVCHDKGDKRRVLGWTTEHGRIQNRGSNYEKCRWSVRCPASCAVRHAGSCAPAGAVAGVQDPESSEATIIASS